MTDFERVLVTGGGGFLGKAIVRKLLAEGLAVTSFSRGYYPELKKWGVRQIQGNLADLQAVTDAVNNIDKVYHVAAKAGVWGPYDAYYQANVVGTQNVLEACQIHGVQQLIYTSSPSVVFTKGDQENIDESAPYSNQFKTAYPKTKAIAEQLVKKAADNELKTIIIRPHLIWGPEDSHIFHRVIERGHKLKIIGTNDKLVDTIYIDNAADAHILASHKLSEDPSLSGNVYFVSQDDPMTLWDIMNSFLDIAGKPPIKGRVSVTKAYFAGAILEFVYKFFQLKGEPPITRFVVSELATAHWFNISKAKRQLGYSPKISTKEGLKRLRQWYLNSG